MQADSPIGTITMGGQPNWSFDLQTTPFMWVPKAAELDRMVKLGFCAWKEDKDSLRDYVQSPGNRNFEGQPPTLTVSFFLAALALENLLKAILLREHPEYCDLGKFRNSTLSSHQLISIADDAGVSLDDEERDLCELGTECILTFGRYHIGKNISQSPSQVTVKESAFPVYENLFSRLKADIQAKPI